MLGGESAGSVTAMRARGIEPSGEDANRGVSARSSRTGRTCCRLDQACKVMLVLLALPVTLAVRRRRRRVRL